MQTYVHTYIHTHIHTYIHIDIHTHTQTYIHAYLHTYRHTHVRACKCTCVLPNKSLKTIYIGMVQLMFPVLWKYVYMHIWHCTLIFKVLYGMPDDHHCWSKHITLNKIIKCCVRWNSVYLCDELDTVRWIPLKWTASGSCLCIICQFSSASESLIMQLPLTVLKSQAQNNDISLM